jgi:hypothetical protein
MARRQSGRRGKIMSYTEGAGDMLDQDQWTSYSHWGMFQTGAGHSNYTLDILSHRRKGREG